jgi:hypothetical protein
MNDEQLIEHLGKVRDLPRLAAELIVLVRAIPYYCGSLECQNNGCRSIRAAREKVIEIINQEVPK